MRSSAILSRPLGNLAAMGLAWACRASPGDAQRPTSSQSSDTVASDTALLSPDSSALEALPDELAPFVGPLAEAWTGDLDSMIARRVIRVLITPTRTQYWIDRGRQSGAEYELLRAFEGWLNQKYRTRRHVNIYVVFIPTSRDALIPDLLAGRGDLAAGILTLTPERLAKVDGGGPFFRGVKELVVTGPQSPAVSSARRPGRPARRGAPVLQLLGSPGEAQCTIRERGQAADQARSGAGRPGGRRPAGDGQRRPDRLHRRRSLRGPALEQDPARPARARGGAGQRRRRGRLADSKGQPQAEAGDRRVRKETRVGARDWATRSSGSTPVQRAS